MSDEARPFVNAKLLKQKCLECACDGRHGSLQGEGLKGSWVPASEIEGLWGGGVDGGGGCHYCSLSFTGLSFNP